MTKQLDLLFYIAKETAKQAAKETAKEAAKQAHYDRNMALAIAKDIYFNKVKREPTSDEVNDLFEAISKLCDEETHRQKKHKIKQYMDLMQSIWPKK